MADLAELIKDRRGEMPTEDFAHEIGMRMSTLYRYETAKRNMSVPNIRKLAAWAKENDDQELLKALASYALGFEINLA